MKLLNDDELYRVHLGDCIPHMQEMPARSVDFSVYSPPFPAIYAYTSSPADIGNSEDLKGEAKLHLSFFYRSILRVMKPGRIMMVHVAQIPRMKRSGGQGLFDFRGLNIRLAERAGFVFEYDWTVRKNPQAMKNGTPVLTQTGWRPIDSLKIGDHVIGANGQPTRVKGVYPHEIRQMHRVSFSDGTSVECDLNHLWQVKTLNGPPKTMTTAELIETGLESPCGDRRFSIPILTNPAALDSGVDLKIDPYTLGCILGDGGITSRGSATLTTEHEIVGAAMLPENHRWRKLQGSDKGGGTVATYTALGDGWHSNILLSELRRLGLHGLRSWEKSVPREYLFASTESRLQLLRGLMDTDGTIKTRNGIVCKFCSTSEQLANDVAFLAQSLGGVARTDIEEGGTYVHKGERRLGRPKFLVSLRMPPDVCPFLMARKASRWKPTKKKVCRFIVSIEPTTQSACTCIEVEASDNLYVTDHCIITHNSQAIRSKSRELQFAGLESDRARSRGALPDYLLKFTAPGENAVPVDSPGQVSRNDWIQWAENGWLDIKETDTLNKAEWRSEDDVKHIAPLQLSVIDRLVRLYSNPGEIVFSPFTGIGSEGVASLRLGRRFYGCEIKEEYHHGAIQNLERAIRRRQDSERLLFDLVGN